MPSPWFVYILECRDGTLYVGITTNVAARVLVHNSGKAARWTRGRIPVTLKYTERQADQSAARKREIEIKRWPRKKKIALFK